MKRILLLATLIIFSSTVFAQKVVVSKRTEKVKNENAEGYASDLDAKSDDVRASLGKFMKEAGKTKNTGDMITVNEPVVNGVVYMKGILYATVAGSDVKTRVWIGIIPGEWNASEVETATKDIEQMVYRFCIRFYKDKIQEQIDEAQRASDAVDKQAQRLTSEGKSLSNKLQNNDEEKIRLEKALEANKLEDLVLKQKIVNNKKSQDSIAQAGVKIKQVIEMHKERQGKVN
ncbi:MAG TPA: hypothetical protein VFE50_03865 [Cyclobacteriaceae bacterium]|nr:hypothetical protein [Cyclobacteriaceae bacterium]